MDCIRAFDVELDRPVYYAGEMLTGHVYLEAEENMRMQNIKVFLRGKAHAEWKITRAGERRTMKQDEHYIDERLLLWGKDDSDAHQGIPILTRGRHRYPFHFQLPETPLPCSFESKIGTIRYYVRVNLNIPYASCPQCIRYFTIIGPNIDCMDERFLSPVSSLAKRNSCSLCCGKGPLLLRATLERTSFVCGEQVKLKAEVQNGSDSEVWVLCKVIQYVEFFINKGVLGLSKEVRHTVLEAESDKVPAHETSRLDELMGRLVVPIMPPTMIEVCGLVQIYYTLKLYLETSKGKGDAAEISMPITIATVPYRIANHPMPDIHYEVAAPNVEGGMYISPEFQLGQVYMGDEVDPETDQTILYRPVYVCVTDERPPSSTDAHLLQVPTRQMARSRENVGSREGVQETMSATQSVQQQMRMFQVPPGDAGGSSSVVRPGKPQDKFLQEITAKIANRQIQGDDESGAGGQGMGDGSAHQSELDAHVQLMRKQQKSNDIVHKALVNELRRHLSEGEDGMEIEKVPPGLKKSVGVKKVSDSGNATDPSKRLKTEVDREAKQVLGESDISSSHVREQHIEVAENSPTKSPAHLAQAPLVSPSQGKGAITGLAACSEDQEEIEYSELSALLTTSSENIHMDIDEGKLARSDILPQSGRDRSSDYQVSMQQPTEDLPQPDAEFMSGQGSQTSIKRISVGGEEYCQQIRKEEEETDISRVRVMTHSPRRIVDNITPAAVAATVTAAAPAAADPSPSRKAPSPQVAPKPKCKDRHSFPAAHPVSGEAVLESSSLSVQVVNRPKSEHIKQEGESHHEDDSCV